MKHIFLLFVLVLFLGVSNVGAGCDILNRDYIVIHKYVDGQIIRENVATNYSLLKNSTKAYLQKQIQKKVDQIALNVKMEDGVRFFVISYVDAFCAGKNVVYDVLSGKKAMASKLYPKNAHAKRRWGNGKNN